MTNLTTVQKAELLDAFAKMGFNDEEDDVGEPRKRPERPQKASKKGARSVEIELTPPHGEKQRIIIEDPENIVAFCGRRFGKTQAGVIRIFKSACEKPGLYWWVGLSWKSASTKRAWRLLKEYSRRIWRALGKDPADHIREGDKEITLPGGSEIWLRTAERPESLAGEAVNGVVLDEFTLMQEIVWTEYVQATLLDNKGWALFIGVPKGKNWAYYLAENAKNRPGWKFVYATTYDNPYIDKDDIDAIKGTVPTGLFNQEYMAMVVDDAGEVFRKVVTAATATQIEQPRPGRQYVMGVDWGKLRDFNAFVVFDVQYKEQVYLDHFNQIDYKIATDRLIALNEKFNPLAIITEINSIGTPIFEQLQRSGLPVIPFTTTNATKQNIIDALALAFEREEIRILPEMVEELQSFEATRLPSSMIRYAAPSGMFDDKVMALALAWQAVIGDGMTEESYESPLDGYRG